MKRWIRNLVFEPLTECMHNRVRAELVIYMQHVILRALLFYYALSYRRVLLMYMLYSFSLMLFYGWFQVGCGKSRPFAAVLL